MPDVSIVISSYNRCASLLSTLEHFKDQDADTSTYEIIVVDNNSTDQTREVVEGFVETARQVNVHYCFEGRQGVSYARNLGITRSRGRIIAFTDDDIRPSQNWISSVKAAFDQFPEADCIGGRVLPDAATIFPSWLTEDHWTPLALMDLGDKPIELDVQNGPGLIGANLAVRSSALNEVGLFDPQLQRVKESIGSMEDHEFLLRLSYAQKRIMYVPNLVVHAYIFPERLTKSYHRRWHNGHGHFFAIMRAADFESSGAKIFDIPGHVYRGALTSFFRWMKYRMKNQPDIEFHYQTELDFYLGFVRQRLADRGNDRTSQQQ